MSRTTGIVVTLVGVGVFAAWLWSGVGAQTRYECETCIAFEGRSLCRKALGPDEEKATAEARRNACALLASGVTQSFACDRVPPTSVTCAAR